MLMSLAVVGLVIAIGAIFLGAVDQNGLVTVEQAKGTAGGREVATNIVTPSPNQFSYGALVDGVLNGLDTAAVIVVDPTTRKVYFTDDATKAAALDTATHQSEQVAFVGIVPDAGQESKSLTWSAETGGGQIEDADAIAAWSATVATAKPRLTTSSLVGRVIGATDGTGAAKLPGFVVINQLTGMVKVVEDNAQARTAVEALSLNAGNSGVMTLSEPTVGETASPLIFEGGSTS